MTESSERKTPRELQAIDRTESEFVDSTIREIAKRNAFGRGKIVSITAKPSDAGSKDEAHHMMSKLEFKTVTFVEDDGTRKEFPLVIKIQIKGLPLMIDLTRNMFSNEVNMFTNVLPLLTKQGDEMFPRCFSAKFAEQASWDIVIMEDLSKQQFHLLERTVTDKSRMSFLVRKLGQFHGSCYRAKKGDPSIVDRLKNILKPTKHLCWATDEIPMTPERGLAEKISQRLIEKSNDAQRLLNSLRSNRYILNDLRVPVEPFAAVVDGDLFSSNIFVRTCEGTHEIKDVRFIDLQTSSYSDPVFDFSFLIFMNASIELVDRHWDDFVADYWCGITSIEPLPGFGREDMVKNIERKALSGFIDACFFLPLTMAPKEELCMDIDNNVMMNHLLAVSPIEAFDKLVSVLQFCINKGFVKKALEFHVE